MKISKLLSYFIISLIALFFSFSCCSAASDSYTMNFIVPYITIDSYWNNQTGESLSLSVVTGSTVEFGVTTSVIADNISWYNGSIFLENDTATSQGNLTHQFDSEGVFYINVSAFNGSDWSGNTTFTVTVGYVIPTIVSYSPSTPYKSENETDVTFSVTFSQPGNITWYFDGEIIQYDNLTSTGSYFNDSSVIGGPYNVTASFVNNNGTAQQVWSWTVEERTGLLFSLFAMLVLIAILLSGYSVLITDSNNYTHIISGFAGGIIWILVGYQSYRGISFQKETLIIYQEPSIGLLFIVAGVIIILHTIVKILEENKKLIEDMEDKY